MTRRLYSYGLPFSEKLGENLDAQINRIGEKKPSLIIIDGGLGDGKSTLAIHCADHLQGKHTIYKNQYGMGGDAFQEKLQICYDLKLRVVIYDEAGDFSKRGSLTTFNKRLVRIFETMRGFNIIIILVLPNFSVLDERIFQLKIPRLLLNCHSRTAKQGRFRAFSLYRMYYLRFKMANKKLVIKEYAYSQVQPNFYGQFLDLSPSRSKELDKICMEGKQKILSDNILASQSLISIKEIARKLNRTHGWVRNKLSKLNIKHKVTYKNRKYYHNSIVDILRQELRYT